MTFKFPLGAAIALLVALAFCGGANAQPVTKICLPITTSTSGIAITSCQDITASNPLPITTSSSATVVAPTNLVKGTANVTGTSSTQLIAAVTSKALYITAFNCANSGSSASIITFQDGNGGTTLDVTSNPAGAGTNQANSVPLFVTTAGNALYFAAGTASTTQYCTASGFSQ